MDHFFIQLWHVFLGVMIGGALGTLVQFLFRVNRGFGSFILSVGPYSQKFYNLSKETKMSFILNADQKVKLTITPVDSYGNISVVENVVWASTNEEVIAIEQLSDTEVYATALGPVGDAQVSVVADAKIGEGVAVLTGVLDFTVLPAEAVALSVVTGTPEPK